MTTTRDELRKLAENATPGPWEDGVDDLTGLATVHHDQEYRHWIADTGTKDSPHAVADAEFIAAARTALPALLDQLDAAEARITRLEAQTDIRGRAVVMYRERAREAEAKLEAVRDVLSLHGPVHTPDVGENIEDFEDCGYLIVDDLRRALDGTA